MGAEGLIFPPGKLNAKTGPPLTYILLLVFFSFSVGCCFFVFLGLFPGDLGF